MKKFLAFLLALTIAVTLFAVPAFAAVRQARGVSITKPSRTVAIDKTIYLDFKITPSDVEYDRVTWSTDDPHLIDIDEEGAVTGIMQGTATVHLKLYNTDYDINKGTSKSVWIGSAETEIIVAGRISEEIYETRSGIDYTDGTTSSSGSTASSTPATTATTGTIPSATITTAVRGAFVKGATTNVTFKSYENVSASSLQSAASLMSGGTVLLNFDTMNGNSVEGRLTINPESSSGLRNNINLGVFTSEDQTSTAKNVFKNFKNEIAVVKTSQSGSYGMNVKIAVKVGDTLSKSRDLRLYLYNAQTNKYSEILDSGITVDSNKYAHFTVSSGGYLVISDGALEK